MKSFHFITLVLALGLLPLSLSTASFHSASSRRICSSIWKKFLKKLKKTKKHHKTFFFHSLFSSSSTTCNLISASMAFLFSSLISSTSCLWLKFLDSSRVFQKSKKRWCWYDVNVPCVTLCCLSDKHTNKDLVSSFQMGQKSRRKHLQPCLLFLF